MYKPMVSCIITTYNRPVKTIMRAVHSVLNQTYGRENIQIIVVNDYPVNKKLCIEIDNTIKKEDNHIIYCIHEQNQGACAARNTGIDLSTGEYLAFLDDDDEWLPEKLEKMVACFTNDNITLVYSPYYICCDKNSRPQLMKRRWYGCRPMKEILRSNFIGSTSLPLLKRSSVLNVGKFDSQIVSSQDHDLWIRLINKYEISFCDYPSIIYNVSEISITKGKGKRARGYQQLIRKYKNFYEEYPGLLHERYMTIACEMGRDHEWKKAFEFYLYAWLMDPLKKDNYQLLVKFIKRGSVQNDI